MTIVSFTGNIKPELDAIETLRSTVDGAITNIGTHLESLNSVWQDEKSVTWIPAMQSQFSDAQKIANENSAKATECMLAIQGILNVNYE